MKYYINITVSVMTVVLALDIIRIFRSRKQVNEYKYKVFSWMTVSTILLVMIFLISSTGSLFTYTRSFKPIYMANTYIFFVAAIQNFISLLSGNYICDTGIWYWGQLYKWSNIVSYSWYPDNNYVGFKMKKKLLGIESELKFKIKECLSEEIRAYISVHLGSSEPTQQV